MKVASLCAGYGGIELGLRNIIDTELVWFSDIEKASEIVMKERFNNIPNLGDLTQIEDPEPVDIVTAGFPCQPVSIAGKQKGINDDRWLIEDVCRVARVAGAKYLFLENVAAILSANNGEAMGRVCESMVRNGFVRWEWQTLRASDAGAPHQRKRWFCVATNTDSPRPQRLRTKRELRFPLFKEKADWGPYGRAISRWENITGRPAPTPTDDKGARPEFYEWLMGLPEGWVSDLDLSYRRKIHLFGNGVVPQQAEMAYDTLLERLLHG